MQARATAKTAATMEPRESILPAALWPVELGEAEPELELELELPEELESSDDDEDDEEVDLAELPLLELDALPPADLEGAVSRVLGMLVLAAGLLSPELLEAAAVVLPESAVAVAVAESEPASAVALALVGSAAAAEVVVAASAGAEDEEAESLDEEPSSAATAEPTPIGAEDSEPDDADEDGAAELLEDALESDESLGESSSAGWSARFWAVTEGEAEAEEDEE